MPVPEPVIRTPISMRSFARAIIRVLRASGEAPTKDSCGVFWAQYALETGAGGFCWNHNLFNHKVTPEQAAAGTPYMMLANTWEIEGGKRVTYQPPHPATWFRSFDSFEAAMSHHIAAIRSGRYASSWPALLAGDVVVYAAKLRERGYYTAPLSDYARLLKTKLSQWATSSAYDDALAELETEDDEPTQPEIRVDQLEPEPAIVHRSPYQEPDDEPPAAA